MNRKRITTDLFLILFSCLFTGISLIIFATPSGGVVQAGNITINSQNQGVDIKQTTQKGIIDWQSFSIGQGEYANFTQPNASAVTLNRVTGNNISEILGQLNANGHILLINPSGIIFGPNARVDVAGLIASTANITNSDFLNGAYAFKQGANNGALIVNQGMITAKDNGMVALVAPGVENSGIIQANLGAVILGSAPAGSAYTVDFYGDGLLQFSLPTTVTGDVKNAIVQSGKIMADGGTVLLSANTAKEVVDSTINMSGIIEANSIKNHNGQIILTGGSGSNGTTTAEISGKMTARGNNSGETGGHIKILTSKAGLMDGAVVDVSGQAGGGEAIIGGGPHAGTNVPSSDIVYVDKGASILANAEQVGNGGKIVLWSDNSTYFYGTAEAKGGPLGGNGGSVETSSANYLDVDGAKVNTSAAKGIAGTWLLDPYDIEIVSSLPTSPGGSFSCDSNISECDWVPTNSTSYILASDIINNFSNPSYTNVTISTSGAGNGAGDITVDAPINVIAPGSWLNLVADNNIYINDAISGNFGLSAQAAQNIEVNGAISNSSYVTLQAGNNIYINQPIDNINLSLMLNAVNLIESGSVTDTVMHSINAAINVNAFYIAQGTWYQNASSLPSFSAKNFSTDGGTFIRVVGGDGSSGSPYQISDVYGLQGIGSNGMLNNSYELANNIDASVTSTLDFTPIGGGNNFPFTGIFDGKNYTISNLTITNGEESYTGLFGATSGATIKNLGLVNANIGVLNGGGGQGQPAYYIGALIGEATDGTTINQVFSTGTVIGNNYVGGLIGRVVSAQGNVTIENVYSTSAVTGTGSNVGGLIGGTGGGGVVNITNAYSAGTVTGTGTSVGGFLGSANGPSVTINNSFWDSQASGKIQGVGNVLGGFTGLTGESTADMQTQSTFTGWDFNAIWGMNGYPQFIWQIPAKSSALPTFVQIDSLSVLPSTDIINEQVDSSGLLITSDYVAPAFKLFDEQVENVDFLLLTSPTVECEESSQ